MDQDLQGLLNNFTGALDDLDAILEKVPTKGLDWSEKEGEWTIRQVIHHLAEDCNVYAFIIEQALALTNAKVIMGDFPGNEKWGEMLAFGERPVETDIELMHAHRKFLSDLVAYFPGRWDNKAVFYNQEGVELATNSVKGMIIMLTEHMQEHIHMIENILAVHQADL